MKKFWSGLGVMAFCALSMNVAMAGQMKEAPVSPDKRASIEAPVVSDMFATRREAPVSPYRPRCG